MFSWSAGMNKLVSFSSPHGKRQQTFVCCRDALFIRLLRIQPQQVSTVAMLEGKSVLDDLTLLTKESSFAMTQAIMGHI